MNKFKRQYRKLTQAPLNDYLLACKRICKAYGRKTIPLKLLLEMTNNLKLVIDRKDLTPEIKLIQQNHNNVIKRMIQVYRKLVKETGVNEVPLTDVEHLVKSIKKGIDEGIKRGNNG